MIQFFLIPIFSIFAAGEDHTVWITDDIESACNHSHVNGCITDEGIITINPFQPTSKGCTVLGHELYHIYGYEENEIPYCFKSQEFRK
jgi:hypothetical protein